MKIKPILLFLFFISYINVFSQNLSVGFNYGYGIRTKNSTLGWSKSSSSINNKGFNSTERTKGSYGEGQYFLISFEYKIKRVGLNLKTGYHQRGNYSIGQGHYFVYGDSRINEGEVFKYSNIYQYQTIPSIKFYFRKNEDSSKVKLYISAGAVFGFNNNVNESYSYYKRQDNFYQNAPHPDTLIINSASIEKQYYGGVSIGYIGAIGMEWKLYKGVMMSIDCSYMGMKWAPKYSTETEYIVDDNNLLNPGENNTTLYIDKPNSNSQNSTSKKFFHPYNAFIFQVGIKYVFYKDKEG